MFHRIFAPRTKERLPSVFPTVSTGVSNVSIGAQKISLCCILRADEAGDRGPRAAEESLSDTPSAQPTNGAELLGLQQWVLESDEYFRLAPTITESAKGHPDRDSAIPRFESWRPSQPPGSLAEVPRHSENRRHFSRLTAKSPVSGEGYRTSRATRREFGGESLLDEFSISEIQERWGARPVAFWQRPVQTRNQGQCRGRQHVFQRLHAALVRVSSTAVCPIDTLSCLGPM
jgi:hypothetical protein